jgi:protein-tyrosine phosphatase
MIPDVILAELPTFTNFRDVGGLRTADGRRLRPGLLFRADSVQDISEAEADLIVDKLGVRYVVDLRTGPEAVQQGRGPLASRPVNYLNIPLVDVDGPKGPPGRVLLEFYIDHLDNDPNLPIAVEAVANSVRCPTLVHCAAGKDRTGLTMLLVELLCGVTPAAARADFLVTATNMEATRQRLRGWPRYATNMDRLSAEIYRCEEHSVDGLIEFVEQRYGSAEAWASAKGVPRRSVELLRERLVEG